MLSDRAVVALALALPLLPRPAFTAQIFFWRRLPRQGDWLPTAAMGAALACAIALFVQMLAVSAPGFPITASAGWRWPEPRGSRWASSWTTWRR